MNEKRDRPVFQHRIFGDVNFDKLDYDKRARFVIERVFERGDVDDVRQCRRYYGDEEIREILTTAKWLSKITIYFAAAILDNEITDYRCYIEMQSSQRPWHY